MSEPMICRNLLDQTFGEVRCEGTQVQIWDDGYIQCVDCGAGWKNITTRKRFNRLLMSND